MGLESTPDGGGPDNANRMYTEEEDRLILTKWWNTKLRPELSKELGRTEAALAQRFYSILKKEGLDPKAYRQRMKQQTGKRHLVSTQIGERPWTREEDIALWRHIKGGGSLDADFAILMDRNLAQLEERYEVLKRANDIQSAPLPPDAEPTVEKPAEQETGLAAEVPVEQEPEDFLKALKEFPMQANQLSHRMDAVENDVKYVKGNIQFALENLAKGLQHLAGYLTEQDQDFDAFETIKRENQMLRDEVAELKQRTEREKKELRQVYSELEFWLSEFMEMRKIEKVANLGELIPKLKYSYDRFGVLLHIEREA